MKTKFSIITQVLRIPNRDEWMIQRQYSDGGAIFTDDNGGKGYTEDEAHTVLALASDKDPVLSDATPAKHDSLFDAVVAAGIKHDHHETDLYLPDTEQVRAILEQFPTQKTSATRFPNQVEGGTWIDVPFAYLPAWEAKNPTRTTISPAAAAVQPLPPQLDDPGHERTTPLRLVAMGYSVDMEDWGAAGFTLATLDGKRQTAGDIITRLLDDRASLASALSGLLAQVTGPAGVWGDGIGNNGKKTGLSGEEFNALRDSRIAQASAILNRLSA